GRRGTRTRRRPPRRAPAYRPPRRPSSRRRRRARRLRRGHAEAPQAPPRGRGARGCQSRRGRCLDAREERLRAANARRRLEPSCGDALPFDPIRLAERSEDAGGGLRKVRRERDRGDPESVGEIVQHRDELLPAVTGPRHLPRLALRDVTVEPPDELPDAVGGARDVEAVEIGGDVTTQRLRRDLEVWVRRQAALDRPVEKLLDHLRRPREQVAEVVAELAFVALVEAVDRGTSVLAEVHGARAPVANGVASVDVD